MWNDASCRPARWCHFLGLKNPRSIECFMYVLNPENILIITQEYGMNYLRYFSRHPRHRHWWFIEFVVVISDCVFLIMLISRASKSSALRGAFLLLRHRMNVNRDDISFTRTGHVQFKLSWRFHYAWKQFGEESYVAPRTSLFRLCHPGHFKLQQ